MYKELCQFKIVVTAQKIRLFCRFSHLITDLFSSSLFHQELLDRYNETEIQAEPFDIYDWTIYLNKEEQKFADKIAEKSEQLPSLFTIADKPYFPIALRVPLLSNSEYESLKSFAISMKHSVECVFLTAFALAMRSIQNFVSPLIIYLNHGRNVPGSGSVHGYLASKAAIPSLIPQTSNLEALFAHFQSEYEYCINNSIYYDSLVECNSAFASQGIIFNNRAGSYYGRKGRQSGVTTKNLYAPDANAIADTPMTFIEDSENGLDFLFVCCKEHIELYKKLAADFRDILLEWADVRK